MRSTNERPPRRSSLRAGVVLAGLGLLALGGCAGYHLGPVAGRPSGATSVQVTPFLNRTLEPHLTDVVTGALRKRLQQDGTYRLATHDSGDILLTGTLLRYDRSELSYRQNDVLTVLDYRVTLTAHVTAQERGTGKVILDREVTSFTLVRAGSDLASAGRQAAPLLAEDLARNVTALLTEGSW
jgi:hypothetical protein